MFHINDRIFTRGEKVDDDELEVMEEWSRCNCCGDQERVRKLKNCHFCGELFCPKCLFKQRPFQPAEPESSASDSGAEERKQ